MQPCMSPGSPRDQRPPTPETDYPELLTSYPEEDYFPVGSFSEPGPSSPLTAPPGWSCHISPDKQMLHTNHFTQEQVGAALADGDTPAQASPPEEKVEKGHEDSDRTEKIGGSGGPGGRWDITTGPGARKKHWSTSWTVLEGGVLIFLKDSKTSAAVALRHPSKLSTPEYTVELKGASLSWAPKEKSSKKNVLEVSAQTSGLVSAWETGKRMMRARVQVCGGGEEGEQSILESYLLGVGGNALVGDCQASPKATDQPGSPVAASLALSTASVESDLSRVRHKLRKFLQRRPTMQSLREKGYIKDQVFGCALAALCERERSPVPSFVQQCIRTVEGWTLDIDGLYRISGHLATIQKLRYKVDHDERLDLDDGLWEDVHVITDALKLFFPELPEPLFPFSHFSQFIAAIKLQDHAQRSRCVRDLVRTLPAPNLDTLRVLFQHLCRVIEHGEQNRMSVQSVAIVFGPTLLRPETEETTVPMTMVFQNQVVELILQQCSEIFPPH
uniref:Rho-GAP domain-containing protein n=1 Tax=Castor canadensis TaxID=51338 RepID=A0A8C0VUV9_CASCN